MEANIRIYRRSGHIVVAYKNNMIVWGGYMESTDEFGSGGSKYHSSDEVWIYNTNTDVWIRGLTKGDIPPRNSGACGIVFDDSLYIFGGYQSVDGLEVGNSNRLFRLNLNTLTWEQLLPEGIPPPPCDKLVGWVYNEKIYFFGGFGPSTIGPNNSRYTYITDTSTVNSDWPGRGWNNQFVCYNINDNSWEWPTTNGPKPGPRAAHAADIVGSTVYLFGGRTSQIRNNELHMLDMETMTWSGDLKGSSSLSQCIDWPEGRSWHSLTFISPDTAVLYGGLNQFNVVLSDCWKLKIQSKSSVVWERHKVDQAIPLLWHKAAYFPCNKDLFLLGGFKKCFLSQLISWRVSYILSSDHTDTVLMIPFAPKSLLRICLDYIIKNGIVYEHEFELPIALINIIEHRRKLANDDITTIYYSKGVIKRNSWKLLKSRNSRRF